ncbi:MAG: indole-3-glycerol phosphate synthase TrpC [Deltaproteobacteria bacterium]|nr:MAG: indole-3-glycerol phosphate synthase TrpC [Deltaproteobacteria bacterium]
MADLDGTYLGRILEAKRAELGRVPPLPRPSEVEAVLERLGPARDFAAALADPRDVSIIAEFKRASPSAGPIRPDADPARYATAYALGGAAAVSVLTDRHFEGSVDDLRRVRSAVSLPVLRKDFVLDRSQIFEARKAGADAVLLIVAALPPPHLSQLVAFAREVGLEPLCEAHDAHELDRAMAAGARVVGVNARDLRTFEIDRELPLRLRERVPSDFVYVAESGVERRDDVRALRRARVDAVLVGTALMRADDPQAALEDLRRVGP